VRVLVTGGSGFIGRPVCRALEADGHVPVLFDQPDDVRDVAAVMAAVGDVDAVIHLAGRLGTSETFGAELDAASVNVLGGLVVADACAHHDVPLVFIGTGHKGQPNPYAITKGCAEDLLLARAEVTGQRIAVVRAFHAYGPGQKVSPPHGTAKVRKIIPSFVCRALTGMPIEIHGDGSNVIDLVHVDDVARALVDSIGGPYGVVLEAGTGRPVTVLEAARTVLDLCGSSSEIVHGPMRVGEPVGAVVVASEPMCPNPFPYGMAETIDYYRALLAR
jgi:UDP-glucose 4-epimerase